MKEESKEDEDDEDFDLFGSDDDEDEEVWRLVLTLRALRVACIVISPNSVIPESNFKVMD